MRPSMIVGVTLLAAAAGAALALTLGGQGVPAAPAGAALALTLGGQGVPAAPASTSPCAPATGPPVARAPRSPAAPPAQAAAVHPVARPQATPAPAGAAPRPENRATLYASGQHLRYSWRTSVVGWLGGTPESTTADRQAAVREGWWGEVEPPLAGRVASQR